MRRAVISCFGLVLGEKERKKISWFYLTNKTYNKQKIFSDFLFFHFLYCTHDFKKKWAYLTTFNPGLPSLHLLNACSSSFCFWF